MDSDMFIHYRMKKLKEQLDTKREATKRFQKTDEGVQPDKVEVLEGHVEFLSLMCRSLLEVLIENKMCTMDGLADLMKRLDMLDGRADGGLETQVLKDEMQGNTPDETPS
ncbi:MAG: hypothetical protein P1V97_07545 [Planctomycetota bacterium]|nr:hypothetical protein [Planctomycetota bacterium]